MAQSFSGLTGKAWIISSGLVVTITLRAVPDLRFNFTPKVVTAIAFPAPARDAQRLVVIDESVVRRGEPPPFG